MNDYKYSLSLNSTMVRLKLTNVSQISLEVHSLNSTMVRLKLFYSQNHRRWIMRSQFHYGSIKTNGFDTNGIELNLVSIPLWFD